MCVSICTHPHTKMLYLAHFAKIIAQFSVCYLVCTKSVNELLAVYIINRLYNEELVLL